MITSRPGVELDGIDSVTFAWAPGAVAMNNTIWIRPCYCGHGSDQVAVPNVTLNRITELGDIFEEVAQISPGGADRGERDRCARRRMRNDKVYHLLGNLLIGDLLAERGRCREFEVQLAFLHGCLINLQGIEVGDTSDSL